MANSIFLYIVTLTISTIIMLALCEFFLIHLYAWKNCEENWYCDTKKRLMICELWSTSLWGWCTLTLKEAIAGTFFLVFLNASHGPKELVVYVIQFAYVKMFLDQF